MFSPDLRTLIDDNTSTYSLVIAVAKRAREIVNDDILKEKCGTQKPVSYALNEFLSDGLKIVEQKSE